ncbi:MAG: response regulator [Gammaproteobacteria bacterium]|nr:response regulator [Gammaproteobacteria bacterium]
MTMYNILLIDDNHDLTNGLRLILESEGYYVDVASNGQEGIQLFREKNYSLVFVDVKLPDMNGVEILHLFDQYNPESRVIIITGYRIEQVITASLKDCQSSVIHEPLNIKKLAECINTAKHNNIILLPETPTTDNTKISQLLNESNINTTIIPDSSDLSMYSQKNYGAIITNTRKPLTTTLNAYAQLKELNARPPLLITMGDHDESMDNDNSLRNINKTGCLFKPFDPLVLLETIKDSLPTKQVRVT